MTIEKFTEIILTPVAAADLDWHEVRVNNELVKHMYRTFRYLVDDWPFITKLQNDCFELYYSLGLSQTKIAQYLNIKQGTVSEHVSKARDSYIELAKIIYISTIWGIDYELNKKRKKE